MLKKVQTILEFPAENIQKMMLLEKEMSILDSAVSGTK
jgi:hypothetical protein